MFPIFLLAAASESLTTPLTFEPMLLALLTLAVGYAFVRISGLRREIAELSARVKPTPAAPPAMSPPVARGEVPAAGLPPELLAVIAAAVHVALGDTRHRIVSLTPGEASSAWSAEGRRDVFLSHRLR